MSRSYKKEPVIKYAPRDGKWGRNQANRRVRRSNQDLSDGCEYKRLYDAWNIHDCRSRLTLKDQLRRWEKLEVWYPGVSNVSHNWCGKTREDAILNWKKEYVFK